MRSLAAATLCLLAFPALAQAEPATIVSREVPLGGARMLAASEPLPRFNLVGLHWQGTGSVSFRTRSLGGWWSRWRRAAPEDEDRPDRTSTEASRPGWRIGNPHWTGASDRIEYRLSGTVRRLKAHFVWSPVEAVAPRTLAIAGAPAIIPRLAWGANELIKRAPPSFAPSLDLAVVHHTAGSNRYTRQQSAAIVRAIQVYHVRGNGWNDIGYNFLVDKFGQVFEGRFGGIERNVIGAHAEGFNTGSVGAAVLGTYGSVQISPAARAALVALLSWRLDVAHVDPLRTFSAVSHGNPRFAAGRPVFLRTIVGHRDTGFTACPGAALYAKLDDFARDVARAGLPKLYAPVVRGSLGGLVRFTARLSGAVPWSVSVTDASGAPVASGAGTGPTLDWTWDARAVTPGTYRYTLGGPSLRPATGTIGRTAALAIRELRAEPAAVTPNGDGSADTTTISYTLGTAATVTATLVDPAGSTVATLFTEPRAAGPQSFVFTAENVPDGLYRIVLTAVDTAGRQVTASVDVVVSRVVSAFAAERAVFSPNADGRLDRIGFTFSLAEEAEVQLRVLRDGKWVATPHAAALGAGPQRLEWDGRKRIGRLRDGEYEAELTVATVVGSVSQRVGFSSDTTRPELRLVSLQPLRLRLSEPAHVVLSIDGARHAVERRAAGRFTVRAARPPSRLRAVAWDPAGNTSTPVRYASSQRP
jgi:hypothetical protein